MKVYLAATVTRQDEMRAVRSILKDNNIEVTSSWLDEKGITTFGDKPSACALRDIFDILSADMFLLDATKPSPSGGKHFETGFAYAHNIPIVIVGKPENCFHFLSSVRTVDDWAQAIKLVGFRRDNARRRIVMTKISTRKVEA